MTRNSNTSHPRSPIFIVGSPRSGTSLLRNLLRSHPRLTFPEESHFIPSFYRLYGDPSDDASAVRLAGRILELQYIRDWGIEIHPEDFAPDRTFAEVLERLFGAWALKEGKARWGDKTPQYVLDIPALVEIFPGARVVHMVRDGRDAALSWMRTGFGPNNVYMAARMWSAYVAAGSSAGRRLGPQNYQSIRFEDLLADPERTLRKLCDFIGESFTPAILTPTPMPFHGTQRYTPARRSGHVRRRTEIVAGHAYRWKTEMAPADVGCFEAVAAQPLSEMGYELTGSKRKISAPQKAYWVADHLLRSLVWKLRSRNMLKWIWTDLKLRLANLRSRQ